MSYSYRKLKYYVDDADGSLRANLAAARQFCLAEDDRELGELASLSAPQVHFASFWGVTRGDRAARAVAAQEHEKLRITWTTPVTAVTSHTFSREGYLQQLGGSFVSDIPLLGAWLTRFRQKEVAELLVVRDGKVVFRHFGYKWALGKF